MKKLYFGTLLYLSGFAGHLTLIIISTFKGNCTYNNIGGYKGFLFCYNVYSAYRLFWVLIVIGLLICILDVFLIPLKMQFKKYK
ncbi:hypothetical protein SH1V18_19210 [Vallitalea longa]|uniref:Uncharacterized protein n=1 Tax=Vallitalea longa TaxID=2936439 RepID=A0A9W5YBH5_9FIRM|nr:hypothetical protein SH1V18_19210 [Vallitalea longa]